MVWGVVESNLRFFRLSVVPDTGSVAMEVTDAEGVAVAVFSNFSFTSFELICDAGVQNPLYKSRIFAVSEDPSRMLNGTLLTLMSARTPSV